MILLAILLAAAPQTDKPGSHDYPLVQRFPHQYITDYLEHVWDTYDFAVNGKPKATVRGKYTRIGYDMEKGAEKPSALEWSRNYLNALTSAGWTIDSQKDDDIVAHLDKDGREVWAELTYRPAMGSGWFHFVEKAPMPVILTPGTASADDYAAIPHLPGQKRTHLDESKFDHFEFEMASGPRHRVEGHRMHWTYDMEKGHTPPSAIHFVESYRQLFAAENWSVLHAANQSVSAMLDDNGKQTWAQLDYRPGDGSMQVVVVEPAQFQQQVAASSLVEQLKREGHLAFPVHFDSGKDVIKDESKPVLAQMVEVLKADPQLKVEVAGHTDALGDDKADQILSEKRAQAVMAALISGGIPASRLTAHGYGKTRPIADNDTEGGRALNRRVELLKH